MSNDRHLEEFEAGMRIAGMRKIWTEQELQEEAANNFHELFDAITNWDMIANRNWAGAHVGYRFGMFDIKGHSIDLELQARRPDNTSRALSMVISEKNLLSQASDFNQKFADRQPPRWHNGEMDDLLPRMTKWLLLFFQAR